jgi:hypothetical protein
VEVLAIIRDVAIIIIAILDIILLSILAVIAFMAWRLFASVKGDVPELLDRAKETATTVKGTTDFVSDRAVKPIIRVAAFFAAVSRFIAVLFRGERSRVV